MKLLVLCATVLFLNGCVHLALFTVIKETAAIGYYNERLKQIENKK